MGMGMGLGAVGGVAGLMQQPTSQPVTPLQQEQAVPTAVSDDPAEALAKLKGLLEQGLITQEQFDAKQLGILSRL
jgi:membrane protease subunit (stomatin/prohibitin family)